MTTQYFPGANTGNGFVSHFSGIVPPWEPPHYTYILKGGPGVGKNTLMKKISCLARVNGLTTEEFRCAGDPGSLDAVRIPEKKLVVLDGTDPHVIEPEMPGIEGEILDLGHFLHKETFARRRQELQLLLDENQSWYDEAYACLGAAATLYRAAVQTAEQAADLKTIRDFLTETFPLSAPGGTRKLFLATPTPDGLVDLRHTSDAKNTVFLPGILGAVFLKQLHNRAKGTKHTVFGDFRAPEIPYALYLPDTSTLLCTADGGHGALSEFLTAPMPEFVPFAAEECSRLVSQAMEALHYCKRTHDAIETIYRPYVDYDRVDLETRQLLEIISF